jgi:large subunit ribosomal protein L29
MKAAELRKKESAELKVLLANLTKEQFNYRMQAGMGQLAKSHQVRKVRKDIARTLQVLREKGVKQ